MSITFAANLNKMITAGLGGAVDAPDTHVAVGYHVERKTVSGNPIAITDGAKNQPVESCVVTMTPIQDTSNGDPSPDNICPISGWTSVTVTLNDTAHTISLPSTVYGGSQEIVSGVGSSTMAKVVLDENKSYSITIGTDRNRIVWNGYESIGKKNGTFVSDMLATTSNASGGLGTDDWQIFGSTAAPRMWITVPSSISTVDAFKAYVAENPITVCYELATPTPITTDPVTDMVTLDGDNTIFTDADSLTVTYRCITYTEGY